MYSIYCLYFSAAYACHPYHYCKKTYSLSSHYRGYDDILELLAFTIIVVHSHSRICFEG